MREICRVCRRQEDRPTTAPSQITSGLQGRSGNVADGPNSPDALSKYCNAGSLLPCEVCYLFSGKMRARPDLGNSVWPEVAIDIFAVMGGHHEGFHACDTYSGEDVMADDEGVRRRDVLKGLGVTGAVAGLVATTAPPGVDEAQAQPAAQPHGHTMARD